MTRAIRLLNLLTIVTGLAFAQSGLTDMQVHISPAKCGASATTTAFTAGPILVRVAANSMVNSITTNTTAGSINLTCDLTEILTRLQASKGATLNRVSIFYGIQTTAMSSIGAATLATITYPAPGGTASGTVASAGGSLTVLPASLQLTTTTSGQCFNEQLSLGTPLVLTTDLQKLTVDQVFNTAGTTATVLQICDVIAYLTGPSA